jgi:HD-GYP domain-containing protein (c-di-GMP phosphodiesterase class II)
MRLVPLDRNPDDASLARDVRTGVLGATPLLRAGACLRASLRPRLAEQGVRAVWISDPASEGVEPLAPLSDEVRRQAEERYTRIVDAARRDVAAGRKLASAALAELDEVAELLARCVADLPDEPYALEDLACAGAYTHSHPLQVAVLGMLLAARHWARNGWRNAEGRVRWDHREERLAKLGLGLLVLDVGKLAIPLEILDKPGPLSAEEWEVVRRHPDLGAELLAGTAAPLFALDVVRSHHERLDGSGYPRGRAGADIHEFARIGGIVDTYHAIVSERVYQAGSPPHVAVAMLEAGAGRTFDADLVASFARVAAPFPLGTEVPVDGGGLVVAVDPDDPWRPVVLGSDGGEGRMDLTRLRAIAAPAAAA